jgi:hypothetical protein
MMVIFSIRAFFSLKVGENLRAEPPFPSFIPLLPSAKAVKTPRAVRLIAFFCASAKTIEVTFRPLNASDQPDLIQVIFFHK